MTTEGLLQRVEAAQRLCDLLNAEIAPAFSVEHITPQEIEEYVQSAASREVDIITSSQQWHGVKAEMALGNRFSACPLLVETIRLTECPVACFCSIYASDLLIFVLGLSLGLSISHGTK